MKKYFSVFASLIVVSVFVVHPQAPVKTTMLGKEIGVLRIQQQAEVPTKNSDTMVTFKAQMALDEAVGYDPNKIPACVDHSMIGHGEVAQFYEQPFNTINTLALKQNEVAIVAYVEKGEKFVETIYGPNTWTKNSNKPAYLIYVGQPNSNIQDCVVDWVSVTFQATVK